MEKVKNTLSNIPETMLITLWAKASETDNPNAMLRDDKAKEIISQIDYDFSKFEKAKLSQVGCCIRTKLIDSEARAFLATHPDAVVVQLGAGLDARYDRLQRPHVAHWFDLDLPEAIAMRRQFFEESERNTFLAESLFDDGWIDKVKSFQRPILIIVEGVLMYFAEKEVKALFQKLCDRLPSATILFDMLAYAAVGNAKRHDALRKMDDNTEFKWSMLYTKEMEKWNSKLHLNKEYYMSKYDEGRFPFFIRMMCHIPYFYRRFNQRIVNIQIG